MRRVKKYPNGRLYDTIERKYLTPDLLSELIKEGAEVLVIDTVTGGDITSETIGKFRRETEIGSDDRTGSMIHRIGKSGEAVTGRIGKYFSLWRDPFSGTEESGESDEGIGHRDAFGGVRSWVKTFPEGFKRRVMKTIDRRMDTVFSAINLATKDQVSDLADRIKALDEKIGRLEKGRAKSASRKITKSKPAAPYASFPKSPTEELLNA